MHTGQAIHGSDQLFESLKSHLFAGLAAKILISSSYFVKLSFPGALHPEPQNAINFYVKCYLHYIINYLIWTLAKFEGEFLFLYKMKTIK